MSSESTTDGQRRRSLISLLLHGPERKELAGRVMMWRISLSECKRLLEKAERANQAISTATAEGAWDRNNDAFRAFLSTRPDYDEQLDPLALSQIDNFRKAHPELHQFPEPEELCDVLEAFRQLAIIFFLRIWNSGFGHGGNIIGNKSADAAQLRDALIQAAFPTASEHSRFLKLLGQLEQARNGLLAHTDGASSGVKHGDWGIAGSLSVKALEGIDFCHWLEAVDRISAVMEAPPDGLLS